MASFFKRLIVTFMISFSFQSDPAGQKPFICPSRRTLECATPVPKRTGRKCRVFKRIDAESARRPTPFCGLFHNAWGTFLKARDIQLLLVAVNAARARSRRTSQPQREGDDWQAAREFVQTLRDSIHRNFLTV
jgi:hypothetical protein